MAQAPTETRFRNRIIGYGTKPADQFQAHPQNWRQHPQAQREAVSTSLNKVGWVGVVVENVRTGHVLDGHERIWQALTGNEDVPYIQVDVSEDEELLVLATFDPLTQMAETDPEMLRAILADLEQTDLFADAEIAALLEQVASEAGVALSPPEETREDPDEQTDRAEALREQWQTERGQLWEIPSASVPGHVHRLLCGDSTDPEAVSRVLADQHPALLLTDPPYGINVVKGHGASVDGSKPVTIGTVRARKPYPFGGVKNRGTDGANNRVDATLYRPVEGDDKPFDPTHLIGIADHAILFGGNYFASKLPDSRCWIVWDKNNTGNFADAELAWTDYDRGVRLYQFTWNGLVREGSREIEGVHRMHPTQKPVGLMALILSDFSDAGDLILDLYAGSGPVLLACELSGRVGAAMEIDPAYCAVVLERLAGMGLKPRLVTTDGA